MFGLFADYKSPEDVLLEFAMKKLKLHYEAHTQLSSIWEDSILKDTRFLVNSSDLKDTPDLKPFYSKGVFSHADEIKEFRRAIVEGEPETLEDLESKLAQVEMMLGNRLMAQNVVEKEINLSTETKLQVKKTEAKVVGLRKILQRFPKRIAELNTTIGKGLLKRKRLIEVIDVLEVIKFTKLLGASTKREMMRLIREQNWQELEPHRFLNIKSVKLAIQSLKTKVPHFEKEVKDDFIQLLQKPNLESFLQLFEFLFAASKRLPDWTAAREKFKKVFMDEMDHFFAIVSSPAKYVEACVHRVTEVLFSPLKIALGLGLDEPPTPLKPKERFNSNISIDPTTMTACITSILVNLSSSMNNWNKITKYTYLHERTLESKLTSETSHLGFLREFRESLHYHRSSLVAEAIGCLERCLAVIREEQISRLNPKVLLRLRATLSRFYAECHQFSLEVPKNNLEAEYTKLIEGYLDQTLNTQLDLLMILMRTSDIEVTTFDWSSFGKQIKEIMSIASEFAEESWYPFGNGEHLVDSVFNTLKGVLPPSAITLKDSLDKAEELKNTSDEAESTISERDSVLESSMNHKDLRRSINRDTIYTIKRDFKRLQHEALPRGFLEFTQEVSKVCSQLFKQLDKVQSAQLDHSGGLMVSFLANYLKLWYFLPEFKPLIILRLKVVSQAQLLFSLLRFIPTIRLQFLLSGGFKLQELNSEEHLSQLENMHDILLYQQKYNRIRREMKELNDLVQQGRLPNLKEKIEASLTEMMVSIPRTEGKDRTTVDLQKILKVVGSMSGYDSIDPFFSRTELIEEVADLLVYNLLLEQARDGGTFEKLSKMKWEELKEPEGLSDYVADVCNSAKTITGHVLKLGAVIGIEQKLVDKINTSVVKFYLNSLVDVYGSVRRITPQAKSQMTLDILSILENCKRLTKEGLKDLEDYVIGFFKHVEYDEPTALRNLVEGLQYYQLRILKNFYFYAGVKDLGTRKVGFSSNSLVVKTEKLVTLFELARSCLIAMLDDEKVIAAQDYSPALVESILAANDKAKQLISSGSQSLQQSAN